MTDRKRQFCLPNNILRCNAAGPENRGFPVFNLNELSVIRLRYIKNSDFRRVADVNRPAVDIGIPARDGSRIVNPLIGDRAHGYNHVSLKIAHR